jgi:hypothetical protein
MDQLERAAHDLAAFASTDDLRNRAGRLAERLAQRRFHISVVGEFKRGKSTLVNALLGVDLMPTGVLPLTAVATEVAYGRPGVTVVHLDGRVKEVPIGQLADYVTEARNPANERAVARVEVRVPVELLRSGVVLVDTPGTGSVFRHDDAASRALLEADGAIAVMSAEAPLSDGERKVLETLSERRAPTFFVLNRVDHLSTAEREEVAGFVTKIIQDLTGRREKLWCVSARVALGDRLSGECTPHSDSGEFSSFLAAFNRYIALDLVQARLATARAELSRLGHELDGLLTVEAAAEELDANLLAERVAQLKQAATTQRVAFADECTLLRRDVAALVADVARSLAAFAATEPAKWERELVDVAGSARIGELEQALRLTIANAVRAGFEPFRRAEAERAEQMWADLAARFRLRTQNRINTVRAAAAQILQIELPDAVVTQIAEERERYFYSFLQVGSSTESIDRLVRRLVPPRLLRRRLLRSARRELAREFDKHAGRARADLAERVGSTLQRFQAAMAGELDRSVQTILDACARAEQLRSMAEAELQQHHLARSAAHQAAVTALGVASDERDPQQT